MIIDLLNFCRYNPGTEATILFRLMENSIRVPSFFCITEDYTEDELNNYLQNHYQHTTHFTVRLSLSFKNQDNQELMLTEKEPPHYVNIPKSILVRYADRLFKEAGEYIQKSYPEKAQGGNVAVHVIVQEMQHSHAFGLLQTACNMGVINETIIMIGEGHDPNFTQRGVPFSIYCHNDDDGILYANEPDGAVCCERSLIRSMLQLSNQLKSMFKSSKLEVKFIADFEIKRIYVISVQKIVALSDETADEIVLDTKGICNYYPGVTKPLTATLVQTLSRTIIQQTFEKIAEAPVHQTELLDLIFYVNGRLYFHTQRLHQLQEVLSFTEKTEEFVNMSGRLFLRNFWKKQGLFHWRKKRKIALGLQHLLEKNLTERETLCVQFQNSLSELARERQKIGSYEQLFALFEKTFLALADCVRANLFNTLYINMNQKLMNRLKPSDKKYRHAADTIAVAVKYRSVLRAYHAKFMELIAEYAQCVGSEFVSLGYIEKQGDIGYLTIEQVYAARDGDRTDLREYVRQKKQELAWFRSMPGFRRLVFHNEIVSAPVGVVGFLDTLMESCYLRGSGLVPGQAVYPAIVCKDNILPEQCDPRCIYIVRSLTPEMAGKALGGLVAEKPDVFANLNSDIAECNFPIVTGAEHACTLIQNGDLIDINGRNGEVHISCMKNMDGDP
ncbi:MAG: hypothetical protein IJ496_06210 [Ruminococcus sp.]|nr:hypothetical protein [Ruminococcus sp.]